MSAVICDVCGFNGKSASYHCRECGRRYVPVFGEGKRSGLRPSDPRPFIWTRLKELVRSMAREGFWDQPNAEVVPVVTEFTDILERLGGHDALDQL